MTTECEKCARSKTGTCFKHRSIACYGCQVKFSPQRPWIKFCYKCLKTKTQVTDRLNRGAVQ